MPDQPGVTTSYFLQQRPADSDEPWQRAIGINASWRDRATADDRLAAAREMRPDREHRLITRTTTVIEEPTSPAYARLKAAAAKANTDAAKHAMQGLKRVYQLYRQHAYCDGLIPAHEVLEALGLNENANPVELAAVLPTNQTADRATVYAEIADRLAADAEQGDKDGLTRIYRRSAAAKVQTWAAELATVSVLPEQTVRADYAQGLLDAAEFVDNDDDCECGGCDTCLPRSMAAELRRLAAASGPHDTNDSARQAETQAPWATDGARIGRTLIWSWTDIGKGAYGKGYRDAQEKARAFLTDPLLAAPVAQQPETLAPDRIVAHVPAARNELHCLRCARPPLGNIWTPVTAEELEDGGICTQCGTDVLLAAQAAP